MIIWQGLGFFGALIPIMCYVLAALIVEGVAGRNYLGTHSWPGALGTLVGAGLVWLLSRKLEKPSRTLLDPQTGETVVLNRKHTLFFVPVRYLAILFAIIAVGMFLFKSDSSLGIRYSAQLAHGFPQTNPGPGVRQGSLVVSQTPILAWRISPPTLPPSKRQSQGKPGPPDPSVHRNARGSIRESLLRRLYAGEVGVP